MRRTTERPDQATTLPASPVPSAQPPEGAVDALIGHTLEGRYLLTRKIGQGGMGTVYEATHVVIGKPMAVKVLREKYVDRPEVAQRLVQEARLASSIRHQHIIDVIDSGRSDGRTFIVMELLDGVSLAELIRRETALSEARMIAIARQVASALGAAHARGILHRDIKPENIFISSVEGKDFVKVVDFGISKTMRAGSEPDPDSLRLTQTGMVLGTPLYMSPEQARGDEDLDHRIDIYALGVILYESLTGEVPFQGTNYLGIIAQVANRPATPPRTLRPELHISEQVERVVMKAMAKVRDERYPTMEALDADLERLQRGDEVAAPAPATRGWGRGVFGGAALLVGLTGWLLIGRAHRVPELVAKAPIVRSEPPPMVVIHVQTDPAGAEIWQGSRIFGRAPRDLSLPQSLTPIHLSFRLEGFDEAQADLTPARNDTLEVQLTAHPQKRTSRPRHHAKAQSVERAGVPVPAAPTKKPAGGETLPNPY